MFRWVRQRLQPLAAVVFLVTSMVVGAVPASVFATPPLGFTGPSSVSGVLGNPVSLSAIQLTGVPSDTISLQLRVSHGQLELTNTTGVTVNTDNPASLLSITGTIANLNTALTHVQYSRDSGIGSDTLEVSTVGANDVYYPGNGHVYRFVQVEGDGEGGGGITWTDAKTAADATTYDGLTGYLATIGSQEENDYVSARLLGAGWMGASDSGSEGVWKWVDGPESGTTFCIGNYDGGDGSCVPQNSRYSNWNNGEPNDSPNEQQLDGGEDCGQYLAGQGGKWNDLPCTGSTLGGYVVEFGEDGHLPTVATKNVTISVTGETNEVSTCAALTEVGQDNNNEYDTIKLTADIDCAGATVEPLFLGGFRGVFDGQGHTIKNFVVNGIDNSYNEGNPGGLFTYTSGATIKNLHVTNATISGYDSVAGVVGYAYNTDFENVTTNATVNGHGYYDGGLVGYYYVNEPGHHIQNSSATGNVTGGNFIGGLVGDISVNGEGTFVLEKSFATGDVSATGEAAGGLIGRMDGESYGDTNASILIQDVYAQGDVETTGDAAGGLIGEATIYEDGIPMSFTLRRAYASGSVTAHSEAGGLIGHLRGPDSEDVTMGITNTFAAGEVSATGGEAPYGAMVGLYQEGSEETTWSGNYFDETRTGTENCTGSEASPGGCSGVTTSGGQAGYFYTKTNAPMTTWDFSNIWVEHASTWPTFSGDSGSSGGGGNSSGGGNTVDDDDADGVTAETESGAPNGGDANGDGQQDSEQANVTSLVNPLTGKYAVLEASGCTDNSSVSVAGESSNTKADGTYKYPAGLMNFTLACATAGSSATVTMYYYGSYDASKFLLRKYNSTTKTYQTVTGATLTNVTIGGQSALKIVYSITDGGALDEDGSANSQIIDPAGPAQIDPVAALANTGLNLLALYAAGSLLVAGAVFIRLRRNTANAEATTGASRSFDDDRLRQYGRIVLG